MDTIRVGTHCFGSREGYRTLARSADVTDAEDAELGGFGFGQTSDHSFLESLEREPSAFGRPLAGGRLAITRIFEGQPDEAGRATLELRTILVAAPDIAALAKAGLGGILQLPGLWKREAFNRGQIREILVPQPSTGRDPADAVAAATVFDAWASAVLPRNPLGASGLSLRPTEDRPVIVAEPAKLGSAAITMLASQLPTSDLSRLRWGVRLISTAGPVDLCTLAAAGRPGGNREVRRVRLDAPASSPAPALDARPLSLARVAAERSMEQDSDSSPGGRWRGLAIAAGVALALLLIAQGTWMWISDRLDLDPDPQQGGIVAQAASAGDRSTSAVTESKDPTAAGPTPNADTVLAPSSEDAPGDEAPLETSSGDSSGAEEGAVAESPSTVGAEPPIDAVPSADEVESATPPSEDGGGQEAVRPVAADTTDSDRMSETNEAPDAIETPDVGAEAPLEDPRASSGPETEESAADAESAAPSVPPDPCAECARLAGRFTELAEDARRAEAFGDREALESTARQFAESMRSIGLERRDPQVQPRVMARVRNRAGITVSMPLEWPWWRELLCRLEALESAFTNLDAVASRLSGRGEPIRQELMRLRKDSAWILGSERADGLWVLTPRAWLRGNLGEYGAASRPSRLVEPQVAAIRAWLLLEPSSGSGSEGRFDPPGEQSTEQASSP